MNVLFVALIGLGLALIAFVLGVAGFVVANFARFLAYLRHKELPAPLPDGGVARGLLGETGAVLIIIASRLFPSRAGTARPAPSSLEGRPVLFVHGYWGKAGDFRAMRAAVQSRGRPTYAVGLGALHAPIESSARLLATEIVQLVERYRDRDGIDIVAHSMGGLVVRRALTEHPELAARVKTLVTLGTPHAGTAHARGYVVGANVRQMRRRSTFFDELLSLERCCPGARIVTVAAELDAIVYPHESCHLANAERVELEGIGHAGLLVHRRSIDAVLSALFEQGAA